MISSSELGNFFKYLKTSNRNIFLKSPPNNLELMITCMFSLILNCKNNLLLPGSTKNWVQNDRKNFRNSNSFFKIFPLNEYPEQQNSIYYFEYFPLLQISLVCWKECPKTIFLILYPIFYTNPEKLNLPLSICEQMSQGVIFLQVYS